MGGESFVSSFPSSEDVSLSGQESLHESINSSISSGDEVLSHKLEDGSVINGVTFLNSGKFPDVGRCMFSIDEAAKRQRLKIQEEVLRSYEELQSRIDRFEEAKNKILSYTPGSWAEKAGGVGLRGYNVPNVTSLLLIGPKCSGKSSLVNKISQALEDSVFLSGRAQVSNNSLTGDGTYFLHEYMVPRDSGSFCLYDTRSLSVDSSENLEMLENWMTKGVRHGELIRRKSDNATLTAQLKYKARRSFCSSQFRAVGFVVFVVNGLSVLESMENSDKKKKQYSQMIATIFNNPMLSFRDDKPVVVVTHGDLLPLSDRVRVLVYLGELLGVPPTKQIFDIPDDNNSATKLAIVDMLTYCLERADRNLPAKDLFVNKVLAVGCLHMLFCMAAVMVIIFGIARSPASQPQPSTSFSSTKVDWHNIRHLWLE